MTFQYSSNSHEKFVEGILNDIDAEDLQFLNMLPDLNSNEKIIFHLSNLWMKEVRHGTDETRLEVHKLQFQLVMHSLGPVVAYLTEEEWEDTEEEWNRLLALLRSFNGSFLGLLYKKDQINSQTADFYNLFTWVTGLYYVFGAKAYAKLRPRIIQNKRGIDFIESNKCMTTLQMNLMDFYHRYEIVDEWGELLAFVNKGWNIVIDFSGGSWESYFNNLEDPPQLPSFSLK
jgi:hypothetical protein